MAGSNVFRVSAAMVPVVLGCAGDQSSTTSVQLDSSTGAGMEELGERVTTLPEDVVAVQLVFE